LCVKTTIHSNLSCKLCALARPFSPGIEMSERNAEKHSSVAMMSPDGCSKRCS
jgi:hypothetical protein